MNYRRNMHLLINATRSKQLGRVWKIVLLVFGRVHGRVGFHAFHSEDLVCFDGYFSLRFLTKLSPEVIKHFPDRLKTFAGKRIVM